LHYGTTGVMDVHAPARWADASERRIDMADMRKCIGSAKFGIEAHEAPVEDFPVQPSRKDGLGTMCKPHWNEYTRALRKAMVARKAPDGAEPTVQSQAAARVATKRAARVAASLAKGPRTIAEGMALVAEAEQGRAEKAVAEACPYTDGRRTCIALGADHAGPHIWPKAASAKRARGAPEPIRTRPARGRKTEGDLIVGAVDAAIARLAAKEASIA
jgi:hypothetical protein